jgi:hypothetical protein
MRVGGKIVRCKVTREALNDRAGSTGYPLQATFNQYRDEIEEIIRRKHAACDENLVVYSRDLNSDQFSD